MRKVIIVVLILFLLVKTVQTWEPTIYTEIKYDKQQLLDSIEHLKEATRIERIVALSDSIIAKSVKTISNKISTINYDYYYVMDYCIDHYQKDRMLSSMTLNEWYEFKQNKSSWRVLASASTVLWTKSWPYTSHDYRVEELNRIETEVTK